MQNLLGLPLDASVHGAQIDSVIGIIHWLMLLLFVGWGAFFVYSLVRFRKAKSPKADYIGVKSHTSTYLEGAVAVFEGVLLIGFAIPFWSGLVNNVPDEANATVVRVVSEQFAWNAHYPGTDGIFGRSDIKLITAENPLGLDREDPAAKDDITTINQLNVPVGKPVVIHLTSKDVIHSFGIPVLRVKHDAIPGEKATVWFTATMTNAQIRDALKKTFSIREGMPPTLTTMVAMADYSGKDGAVLLKSGDAITEDLINQLREAGVQDVVAAPDTPAEIACAQLCGLGHFRMRGFVNLQTPEDYQAWLKEEASYLE